MPVFYKGRGDLGRTDTLTQTDLFGSYDIKLTGNKKVQLSVNVINVFDQDASIGIFGTRFRDRISITNEAFFRGFDTEALGTAQNRRRDARYGQPYPFQNPREVRLALKYMF